MKTKESKEKSDENEKNPSCKTAKNQRFLGQKATGISALGTMWKTTSPSSSRFIISNIFPHSKPFF